MKTYNSSQIKPLVVAIGLALGLTVGGNAHAINLKHAVQHTINTNPEILIQKNEYLARREEVRQAEAGYYPTVDVNAGVGYEWTDSPTTRGDDGVGDEEMTRRELGITAIQPLFDGGATRNEVERHRARARATAHQIDGEAEKAGLSAVQVYLEVRRRQKLLNLAKKNLEVHERIHDQIKLRSESGVGRKADLDQIEARLALAENNIIAGRVNLEDAKTNYVKVVGQEAGSLAPVPSMRGKLPRSKAQAVQMAQRNHPILKSAYADVDAALEQHEAAAHNNFPKLNFEVGATHNEDIDGVDGENNDFTAMLQLTWNLYNGGKDQARRRETAHQINQAKDIRNRTHRQVEESVRLSWAAYKATERQIALLRKQVNANIKTRDAYIQQFNLNERTLLDVLNTENDLYQSRQDLVEAETDNVFAQYRIGADLGRLTEWVGVAMFDEATMPEYNKALGIRDYTDDQYPNSEYMKVVEDHTMEVLDGPNDHIGDDAVSAKETAPSHSGGKGGSPAATASLDTATEAMADKIAYQVSNTVGTAEPDFNLQDIGIAESKPMLAQPTAIVQQDIAPMKMPVKSASNSKQPTAVTKETGGSTIAGFWRNLFN